MPLSRLSVHFNGTCSRQTVEIHGLVRRVEAAAAVQVVFQALMPTSLCASVTNKEQMPKDTNTTHTPSIKGSHVSEVTWLGVGSVLSDRADPLGFESDFGGPVVTVLVFVKLSAVLF